MDGLLSADQKDQIIKFSNVLNRDQLLWASGYLDGLLAQHAEVTIPDHSSDNISTNLESTLTILVGSRTGNGEGLAKKAKEIADKSGLTATIKDMNDYRTHDLSSEKNLLVIVSTHGEGEPPFAAKTLHDYIFSKRAPDMNGVTYAVLGLGDSSYFMFCQTGKDFDEQFEKLGASRLVPIMACDEDYEVPAFEWLNSTIGIFRNGSTDLTENTKGYHTLKPLQGENATVNTYSRKNPFMAPVFDKILLHGKGIERQTIHLELNIEGAVGLSFEPGDAAGVMPVNSSELIEELLTVLGLKPDEQIIVNGQPKTLYDSLYRDVELSKITVDVVNRLLKFAPNDQLQLLTTEPAKFKEYLEGRDIIDLFLDYPTNIPAEELVKILRPLQPRYYSISSSSKAFPGEMHLTVGMVNYESNRRKKQGTCTTFLSALNIENENVPLFIESNPGFRLPDNDETPIIMVGVGTGIAPFRAFIQHRELNQVSGKSWLFFGNRNFETEFLYQNEWQDFMKNGALTNMDVAFSRDGDQKVYVQDRLIEKAVEVYQWLEQGAHFYICGDMKNMARNVQDTLVTIIENQGMMSKEKAQDYIGNLEKEKRLQLDVY